MNRNTARRGRKRDIDDADVPNCGSAVIPYPHATELVNHWWWRPGWSPGTHWYAWHFTLAAIPELQQLAIQYQAALRPFPSLDLIPAQWLHITVQGLGNVADVPDEQRRSVQAAVADRLSGISAPELTFHRPVLHREAVVVPPTDLQPLQRVRTAIRQGIADTRGDGSVPEGEEYRPHFSLAYVNRDEDPAAVLVALDNVEPVPVSTVLGCVSLIDLRRDDRMYMWKTISTICLSSSPPAN